MEELFKKIQLIHPDIVCIRVIKNDVYLVFPPTELEKQAGNEWSGKFHSEMCDTEFVPNSPTRKWFDELYDYFDENEVELGDYSF